MIPKIFHYVWVGDREKPLSVLQYIDTWRKYCPEYTIIEWNNDCLERIDNKYVCQAKENKKWAFVSDYIRLMALYKIGGFYLDTDIEITNNLDLFLKYEFVSCYEDYKGTILPISTSFVGAEKGNRLVKELMCLYDDINFENEDGTLNTVPNTIRFANLLKNKNIILPPYNKYKTTILKDNHIIFPATHFCICEEGYTNYAIHHFDGSWLESFSRRVKFKIFKFKVVRFKKIRNVKNESIPLDKNERMIKKIKIKDKIYAILWCE